MPYRSVYAFRHPAKPECIVVGSRRPFWLQDSKTWKEGPTSYYVREEAFRVLTGIFVPKFPTLLHFSYETGDEECINPIRRKK